jgi:hypothetical protein
MHWFKRALIAIICGGAAALFFAVVSEICNLPASPVFRSFQEAVGISHATFWHGLINTFASIVAILVYECVNYHVSKGESKPLGDQTHQRPYFISKGRALTWVTRCVALVVAVPVGVISGVFGVLAAMVIGGILGVLTGPLGIGRLVQEMTLVVVPCLLATIVSLAVYSWLTSSLSTSPVQPQDKGG